MREAYVHGMTSVNPKGHPEPVLPSEDHLRGHYRKELTKSNPVLLEEADKLIDYVSGSGELRNRRSQIQHEWEGTENGGY